MQIWVSHAAVGGVRLQADSFQHGSVSSSPEPEALSFAQDEFAEQFGLEVPPRPEHFRVPAFIDPNNSLEQWKRGEGTPQPAGPQIDARYVRQRVCCSSAFGCA